MKAHDKFILITNLNSVSIGPVRTCTHAFLLEETEGIFRSSSRVYRARGFGTEGSAPIFDIAIESLDYKIGPMSGAGPIIMGEGDPRPLFHIAKLTIGAVEMILGVEDSGRPIDIQRWEGTAEERTILKVWQALPLKVADYWSAPRMPIQEFLPPARARAIAVARAAW